MVVKFYKSTIHIRQENTELYNTSSEFFGSPTLEIYNAAKLMLGYDHPKSKSITES